MLMILHFKYNLTLKFYCYVAELSKINFIVNFNNKNIYKDV